MDEKDDKLFWEIENAIDKFEADYRRDLHLNGDCFTICKVFKKFGLCPYERMKDGIEGSSNQPE
jgi:hypothetical protein